MKQFIEDQDDNDKDYENNDAINCEICYEKFSIEKMPMILKCKGSADKDSREWHRQEISPIWCIVFFCGELRLG